MATNFPGTLRDFLFSFARAFLCVGLAGLLMSVVGALPVSAVAEVSSSSSGADAPPLPSFEGRTLDGKQLGTSAFAGKRIILLCFNPGVEQATAYARALARVSPERGRFNFAVVGVAMGLDPAAARAFATKLGLDFPIFDDSDGNIAERLGLRAPLMLVGADGERRVGMAMVGFEHGATLSAEALEGRIREYLRLPGADAAVDGKLVDQPKAPTFEAERLDGGETFRLAAMLGKPLILTFFQPSCSHCQDALRFFKEELARMPDKTRPMLVGVSTDNREYAVETILEEEKLNYFPVLMDPEREVALVYGSFSKVPDILLIDASGRIVFRKAGWDAKHDPNVMRMQLASLVGAKIPMLLSADGYSGNDSCAVCHATEAATWSFTEHAFAFDTLVTRGVERDPKCVGCHVVGFGERGGYTEKAREEYLENVGCESCHGRGGGHLEAKTKPAGTTSSGDYRAACARCHDTTHSLGFQYETFLPKISHAAIGLLSDAERAKRVADRERPRDLLPTASAYVGSAACQSCHNKEFEIWSRSAHANSTESLRKKGKEGNSDCVSCHVTGYGRPGGFPKDGRVRSHEDLARVGCESCHGPGADHVKDGGKHAAGIVKLADKCDSCVILQICGACHDDANDPQFRFNVESKIEIQRHGSPSPAAKKK